MSLDRERRRNSREINGVMPLLLAAGTVVWLSLGLGLWYASKPRENPCELRGETEFAEMESEDEIKERERYRWKAWGSGFLVGSGAVLGIGGAIRYCIGRMVKSLSQ